MSSAVDLSRRYIEAFNAHDLEALVALVAPDVDFKRPDEAAMTSQSQVRAQYVIDWSDHDQVHVEVLRLMQSGSTAIAEIEVDAGPPSHEWYRGTVIHDWSPDGAMVRYRLYLGDTTRPDAVG